MVTKQERKILLSKRDIISLGNNVLGGGKMFIFWIAITPWQMWFQLSTYGRFRSDTVQCPTVICSCVEANAVRLPGASALLSSLVTGHDLGSIPSDAHEQYGNHFCHDMLYIRYSAAHDINHFAT